jgi:hypothetical protein
VVLNVAVVTIVADDVALNVKGGLGNMDYALMGQGPGTSGYGSRATSINVEKKS